MENLEKENLLIPYTHLVKEYRNKSLNYTDTENRGDILLVGNPTGILESTRYWNLKYYTIKELKMLAVTDNFGKINLLNIDKIGIKSIPLILSAIELYSSQVERQAQLTKNRNINLFTLHKERKLKIVEELYSEIILYLMNNADNKLFWGNLSDAQKKLYISSTIYNKQLDRAIRSYMINAIANYTTLPELKNVTKGKMKVLNRFL